MLGDLITLVNKPRPLGHCSGNEYQFFSSFFIVVYVFNRLFCMFNAYCSMLKQKCRESGIRCPNRKAQDSASKSNDTVASDLACTTYIQMTLYAAKLSFIAVPNAYTYA